MWLKVCVTSNEFHPELYGPQAQQPHRNLLLHYLSSFFPYTTTCNASIKGFSIVAWQINRDSNEVNNCHRILGWLKFWFYQKWTDFGIPKYPQTRFLLRVSQTLLKYDQSWPAWSITISGHSVPVVLVWPQQKETFISLPLLLLQHSPFYFMSCSSRRLFYRIHQVLFSLLLILFMESYRDSLRASAVYCLVQEFLLRRRKNKKKTCFWPVLGGKASKPILFFIFFPPTRQKYACRDLLTVKYTECGLRTNPRMECPMLSLLISF